jgi:asparagine synthase (glutamine-hydrolysing)
VCGIAGIHRFDGVAVDPGLLERMSAELTHRGPDDAGLWTHQQVGFAHRRLSIIDVGGSPQPMTCALSPVTICFNGEILNYQQLRRDLDYPFRTAGDTETLLALYHHHGIGMLERLRGQFAFALHDARIGTTWLVRDRVGILPLYYRVDDASVAFASEIKALLPAMPGPVELDAAGLGAYLAHRSVPAPRTLVAGVRKVLPGAVVELGDRRSAASERRWWRVAPPGSTRVARPRSPGQAVDAVHEALRASVAEALVADVPVGAYLSGGVDSSLIVALVAEQHGAGVETFSAGFGDERTDETSHARAVSDLLGTVHHEVAVRPRDLAELWDQLTWHRDAPLSEPADVAVYRLAELAGTRVKVVLSGEGSDELFGGYPKYRLAWPAALLERVPSSLRAGFGRELDRRLPVAAHRPRVAARALTAPTRDELVRSWFAPFTHDERRRLLGRTPPPPDSPLADTWAVGDPLRRMLAHDVGVWLPDNLLERGDRMTMAASVELRPPFLDPRLVDLAFALPASVKVRGSTTKWVVKEVARRYLPASIVDRPKSGFKVPLDRWFREGLRDDVRSLLLGPDAVMPGLLDRDAVAALVDAHQAGQRNEDIRLWTLLGLEVWARRFLPSGVAA